MKAADKLSAASFLFAKNKTKRLFEGLHLIARGTLSFNFWIGEILLGMVVPMILVLYTSTRMNRFWRMTALFPVAAGVVAYGRMAFSLGVKYLPVVDHPLIEKKP
jgi:Ni/Fe-hydrogenase subunit HybB-like protein